MFKRSMITLTMIITLLFSINVLTFAEASVPMTALEPAEKVEPATPVLPIKDEPVIILRHFPYEH